MTDPARRQLPPAVEAYVRRFAVRRRRLAVARRVGLGLSVSTLFALTACLADRLLRLSPEMRSALLSCAVGMLVVPAVWPVLRLFKRVDYLRTAARIERQTPRFDQRLLTLVSQYRLPPTERGSSEFLATLSDAVTSEIHATRVSRLLPWSRVAGPWFLLLLTAALVVVGWRASWLGLPQLATRLALPFAGTAPVTTTRLLVSPGPASIVEGQPLTIQAKVSPIPHGDVVLRADRSTTAMSRSAAGVYELTIPRVDRPFTYTVEAGDAASADYTVDVLRRPAVTDLRVRYDYPPYARRDPVMVTTRDGIVEAPVGTRATVQVVSTERLHAAALVAPGARVELVVVGEGRVAEATLEMTQDQRYQVDLVSDRGVPSPAAGRVLVRPVPDRPPVVRLVQPVDDLRLDPHAVLPIAYDAADDIGVHRVTAHVRVNAAGDARDVPITTTPAGPRADAVYDLDLAPFDLKVGDVVAISVSAADGLDQASRSDERHVLITPRTIDIATYQRLAELQEAARAAERLLASLDAARKAHDDLATARPGADRLKKLSALNQQLAGAAEAAALLRRSLTAAIARSDSPRLSTALAAATDSLAVATWHTARAAAQVSVGRGEGPDITHRIDRAIAPARALKDRVTALTLGQQAAATLADRANLRSAATLPTTQSTADRVRRTLDRARADVTAAALALGLDVSAPDLDARLRQLVDAADALMQSHAGVDLGAAAAAWDEALPDRLDAAASAHAARPDADPAWVEDLRLAARAARAADEGAPTAAEVRTGLGQVLSTLQADNAARATGTTRPAAAVESRGRLRRWAGEADLLLSVAEAIARQAEQHRPEPAPGAPTPMPAPPPIQQTVTTPAYDPAPRPPRTPVRGIDPPGYTEALDAYFQAISKDAPAQ